MKAMKPYIYLSSCFHDVILQHIQSPSEYCFSPITWPWNSYFLSNFFSFQKLSANISIFTDDYVQCFRYDHPHVIAGAGSIGIELMEQLPNIDAILIPVGGGGLLAGIATVVKTLKPDTLVYVNFSDYAKIIYEEYFSAIHIKLDFNQIIPKIMQG